MPFFGLYRGGKTPCREARAGIGIPSLTVGAEYAILWMKKITKGSDGKMKIAKRNGNLVFYDDEKVVGSIMRANEGTGEDLTAKQAEFLADAVLGRLIKNHSIVTTQMIRDGVYEALKEKDLWFTAKQYKEFKKDEK